MSIAARREATKEAAAAKVTEAEARAAAVAKERTAAVLHDIDDLCGEQFGPNQSHNE